MTRSIAGPLADPGPPRAFTPPVGATDAHCHIFGPQSRFPFAAGRTYTPPDSGLDDLIRLQAILGLSRAVVVQASCHGTDNRAMLDALERGVGSYAGVAMVDDSHDASALAAMHDLGVRGIRFNFVGHLGAAPDLDLFWRLVERVAPLGWHVELHFDAGDLSAYRPLCDDIPVPFIIDHMGRIPAGSGVGSEPFGVLADLLASNESAWVKLSGAERLTADGHPPYDDVAPMARSLIDIAPDRVLWGTDWPHPNVQFMPDDGQLLDALALFASDEVTRKMILVDNPQRLYDFAPIES